MIKFFIVLLLIECSLQQEDVESVCDSACGAEGYCEAKCAYKEEEVLCECYPGRDGTTIECVTPGGESCTDINEIPTTLEEADCEGLSTDTDSVIAYTYSKLLGRAKCTLLTKCLKENANPNPTPIANAKKKCGNCPALGYTYGPTAIHYDCGVGDLNPYAQDIPTGTTCSPTHSCEDVSSSDVYTCILNPGDPGVGKWQKEAGGEFSEETPTDVTCDCPELKVADEIGTKLSCTTPVEADSGFYTLTEANTCGLICDGFYILELTCGFKDEGGEGTVWKAEWDDGYTQDLEVTCLACLDNTKCDEATTDAPPTSTSTSTSTEETQLRQ